MMLDAKAVPKKQSPKSKVNLPAKKPHKQEVRAQLSNLTPSDSKGAALPRLARATTWIARIFLNSAEKSCLKSKLGRLSASDAGQGRTLQTSSWSETQWRELRIGKWVYPRHWCSCERSHQQYKRSNFGWRWLINHSMNRALKKFHLCPKDYISNLWSYVMIWSL